VPNGSRVSDVIDRLEKQFATDPFQSVTTSRHNVAKKQLVFAEQHNSRIQNFRRETDMSSTLNKRELLFAFMLPTCVSVEKYYVQVNER
jgi:hypothetical protein